MWENFKEWFLSNNFIWFMLGWQVNELLTKPSLLNLAFVGFWVWLLTTDV